MFAYLLFYVMTIRGLNYSDKEEMKLAKRHYEQASVDGTLINLNDDVYVTVHIVFLVFFHGYCQSP